MGDLAWAASPGDWWGRFLFQRALAVTYLVAFVSTALQFRPLLGADGIFPVARYVERAPFRRSPWPSGPCPGWLYLMVSGNFSWLNWLTIAIALPPAAALVAAGVPTEQAAPSAWFVVVTVGLTATVVVLSLPIVRNLVAPTAHPEGRGSDQAVRRALRA